MFSYAVKAHLLCDFDICDQRFFVGRGKTAFLPIPLIEQQPCIKRATVKKYFVSVRFIFAQSEVASYAVRFFTFIKNAYFQIVQCRVFRNPKFYLIGQFPARKIGGYGVFAIGGDGGYRLQFFTVVKDIEAHFHLFGRFAYRKIEPHAVIG